MQECYISVCKEKDKLEENLQREIDEERRLRKDEVRTVLGWFLLCYPKRHLNRFENHKLPSALKYILVFLWLYCTGHYIEMCLSGFCS